MRITDKHCDIAYKNHYIMPSLKHLHDITTLDASGNMLKLTVQDIKNLPPNIENLILNNNSISTLINCIHFPPTLKGLSIIGNNIPILDGTLLYYIEVLDMSRCRVNRVVNFPPIIKELNLADNLLYVIPSLPITLIDLNISSNLINTFPTINHRMCNLDISYNKLQRYPQNEVTKTIGKLNLTGNTCCTTDIYESDRYPSTSCTGGYTYNNTYGYNNSHYSSDHLYKTSYRKTGTCLNDLSERKHFVL